MEDKNTISGFHVRSKVGEPLKIHSKKYIWHIPKILRGLDIQPGDIVGLRKTKAPVLVVEVYREELEDTGKYYKKVGSLYERAPKKV